MRKQPEGGKKMNSQRRQASTITFVLLIVGLVIGVGLSAPTCYAPEPPYNETGAKEFDPEDLPWSNETDVIILPPVPPLPPIFSNFSIAPTEIELGDYIIISFVIKNINNRSQEYILTMRIGDITQNIGIELENYESKTISYRIIPHIAREYDVWVAGYTGTFKVTSITPEPDPLEELNLKIDYLSTNLQDLTREFFLLQTAYNTDVEELNSKIDNTETTLETYSNEVNEQIESLENKLSVLRNTALVVFTITFAIAIAGIFVVFTRKR